MFSTVVMKSYGYEAMRDRLSNGFAINLAFEFSVMVFVFITTVKPMTIGSR